jgi:hypothetical protein
LEIALQGFLNGCADEMISALYSVFKLFCFVGLSVAKTNKTKIFVSFRSPQAAEEFIRLYLKD